MTSCSGCNVPLGWKKYNFQKQWRIPGYFCKECMIKLGHDFDSNGYVTVHKSRCDSCLQELFFLKSVWSDKKRKRLCSICKDVSFTDPSSTTGLSTIPSHIPIMVTIFAAFGILLMVSGFVYVLLVAPQQDAGLLHVVLGSIMSGVGLILARKMVKIRNTLLGQNIFKK